MMNERKSVVFTRKDVMEALVAYAKARGVDVAAEASISVDSRGQYSPGGESLSVTLSWQTTGGNLLTASGT